MIQLFRKKELKVDPIIEDTEIVEKEEQPSGVKFYNLLDFVQAEKIVDEVKKGNLIFLNIGRITPYPDRKKDFLESLKLCSDDSEATLRMVSDDTIMVAPSKMPIEVRALSSMTE